MATNTRILLVTAGCPGPYGGASQYDHLLMRGLADLGYDVYLVFASQNVPPEGDVLSCVAECHGPFYSDSSRLKRRIKQVWSIAKGQPTLLGAGYGGAFQTKVCEIMDRINPCMVVVSHLRIGHLVPLIRKSRANAKIIFVDHNCETDIRRQYAELGGVIDRIFGKIDMPRIMKYEGQVILHADKTVVLSKPDVRLLESIFNAKNVGLLPPVAGDFKQIDWDNKATSGARRILYCGSMSYRAKKINVKWLVESVYPEVLKRLPDARLDIVGPSPPRYILAARRRYPGLTVTGWVDDVKPYYYRASACVLPTVIGGGFELKTVEAAGIGCPMVGTRIPIEACALEHDVNCLCSASAEGLAADICRLLEDESLAKNLARKAYDFVRSEYSWDMFKNRLARILADVA